ncbi:helix-turn-helix transcriptional regulator [Microlunatus soli]|uniref:AraC-type DNA-binding protein n=1 Tax=Microlunatus soli TaxID=630515 RepID=A0A1H1SEP0_9ACTN|nr:helix-turn-helix transcriptional regulator [Microlunatus soli]SDS46323.1 AraC-type DNA-binding protein [Microlunatus soli]
MQTPGARVRPARGRSTGEPVYPGTVGNDDRAGGYDEPGTYDEQLPHPDLRHAVRTVWIQRVAADGAVQRHLPTGGIELQATLGRPIRLLGPLTCARVEPLEPGAIIIGIRFWPGAFAPLSAVPARELTDQVVPLAQLWGGSAVRLGDQLARSGRADRALQLLQDTVISRLRRAPTADRLITEAVRRLMPWRPAAVATIASELSISESQLRRRFDRGIGTSPKTLQRTLRLQGYLSLAQAGADDARTLRVTDLAARVGYTDQPHLTHECMRLTGVTPRRLLGTDRDRCGCGHDHAASYRPFLGGIPQPR